MADKEIDLGQAIGLAEAARLMRGRGGKAPSVETVRRWANPKRGCWPQGKEGPQLILLTARVNGELLTTEAWVKAFEDRRLQLGMRQPPAPQGRPPSRRAAAHRRAEERLREAGT
jgi:hypothetical protein